MSTPTRTYIVRNITDPETVEPRLVRATNQAQALRHVATDTLRVSVATQDELIEHVGNGVEVECATATQTAHGDE